MVQSALIMVKSSEVLLSEAVQKLLSDTRDTIREQGIIFHELLAKDIEEKIDPLTLRVILETYTNYLGRAHIIGHELGLIFKDMEVDLAEFSEDCNQFPLKESKKRFFGILKSYTERLSFVPGVEKEDYKFFFHHVDAIISDNLAGDTYKKLLYDAIELFLVKSKPRTKLLFRWKLL